MLGVWLGDGALFDPSSSASSAGYSSVCGWGVKQHRDASTRDWTSSHGWNVDWMLQARAYVMYVLCRGMEAALPR